MFAQTLVRLGFLSNRFNLNIQPVDTDFVVGNKVICEISRAPDLLRLLEFKIYRDKKVDCKLLYVQENI